MKNKALFLTLISIVATSVTAQSADCNGYACVPMQNQYATWWASHQFQNLSNTIISQSQLSFGADFYKASLSYATKGLVRGGLIAPYTNFFNANLCNTQFLANGNWHHSFFPHSFLANANASFADLRGSVFYDINMTGFNVQGANLANAVFDHVNMTNMLFTIYSDGSVVLKGVELLKHPSFNDAWSDSVRPGTRMYLVKAIGKAGWQWSTTNSTATNSSSN